MKTTEGYRFSLQFKALSDAHRQVGEYLESLGNKKSEAVVTAFIEYLLAHPEVLNKDNPVRAVVTYGFSEETLNKKIEAMFQKITGGQIADTSAYIKQDGHREDHEETDERANALDALLKGLDSFC